MRFESRQRIQGTVDEVEKAMLDERYVDFLLKHHRVLLAGQPLQNKAEGRKVRPKVRYRPKPVIQSVGAKEEPAEWFAFVEDSSYDKGKKALSFTNTPTSKKISNMLVNTGTLTLRDAG